MEVSKVEAQDRFKQIGALARIDSDTIVAAIRNVRQGPVYDLGLEISDRVPHGPGWSLLAGIYAYTGGDSRALAVRVLGRGDNRNTSCGNPHRRAHSRSG
jgi:hypothetical protein